jgi:hypothetical protein
MAQQSISLDMKSQAFIDYRRELAEIGPITSAEQAAKYREVWAKYHGKVLVFSTD